MSSHLCQWELNPALRQNDKENKTARIYNENKKEVVQNKTELQGHNALINEQVCVLPLTGTIMLNDMFKRQMIDYFLHKNNFCNLKFRTSSINTN